MATELDDLLIPEFDENMLDEDMMNVVPLGVVFLPTGGEKESLSEAMKSAWDWRQPRKCIICGKEFVPRNSKHMCCSLKCWYRKRYANRELHSKTSVVVCKWCGKKFINSSQQNALFCSQKCAKVSNAYSLKSEGRLGFQVTGKALAEKRWSGHVKQTQEEKENAKRESIKRWRNNNRERVREWNRNSYRKKKERERATNEGNQKQVQS